MCRSPLHDFLCAIPKVEHHIHLEGTLTPDLLYKLAAKNKVDLPSPDKDPAYASPSALTARYGNFTSLDDFLGYYFIGMSALITDSDFEDLTYAYFTKAHCANVQHVELFFDPQAHLARGVSYDALFRGIQAGCQRAQTDFNISSLLIPCLLRHFTPQECHSTYLSTILPSLQTGQTHGLGLSSTERDHPPTLYTQIFTDAHSHGIKLTAHAGEEGPAEYMSLALSQLHVSRIDHGIKAVSDPELMSILASKRILITMCPVSNKVLRAVKDIKELPIRTYLDNHVPFSINSDDPAYFGGTYIQENYCAVQEAFDLSKEEWTRIVQDSIELSWCGEERKAEMLGMLKEVVDEGLHSEVGAGEYRHLGQ